MKQHIDCLIETLRLKASEAYFYSIAADRLEELQKEYDNARAEVERVKACCLEGDKMLQRLKAELESYKLIAAAKEAK